MGRIDGPRYLVVEGPIGVGKTSLALRLAESLQGDMLLEKAEDGFIYGFTPNYIRVKIPATPELENQITPVILYDVNLDDEMRSDLIETEKPLEA